MKRISPIVSSIITAIVVYIAILLNQEVGKYLGETYNITQSYIFRALILLVTGICIGWNLWMLQKADATIVVTSIIVDIVLIAVSYFGIFTGMTYPVGLIGIYIFVLVTKFVDKKGKA
mgnify:FL=1